MNERVARTNETEEALRTWPYRFGMSFYRTAISAFFAAGGLRRLRKKYRDVGLDERTGNFSPDVPRNALWVHSVSVGEVQSALSLIRVAKANSDRPCVLSTVTTTGRAMAEKLTSDSVDRFVYSPWDTPGFVTRALDTLTPHAYVAMETERWPTMLYELHRRGIPTFLVNGRLSEESAERLLKMRTFWRGVLCCFDRLMVRFESDREKFLRLGVPEGRIVVTGDCKVDAMLERKQSVDPSKWAFLRRGPGSRNPLFLAGSTHEGEEEHVLDAFHTVRTEYPEARLILVPRHPERACSLVAAALPYGKANLLSDISGDWDILVVNKIGVLFELYAVADAAFVGGSLVRRGGQNLMEPALFGIQVTHGPDMSDFPDADRMDSMIASLVVYNAQQLAEAWTTSLTPTGRARVQQACRAYFETVGGAAARSWDVIRDYMNNFPASPETAG